MIEGLKPYPKYKESGVAWVGRIPEHWSEKRGKALFAESRLPVRESDEIVTCFRDGQVTLRRNRRSTGYMIALKEQGYQGVRCGQLVIHAMDAFAGATGVSDSEGKCTPEYIVCDPRGQGDPRYFAQALRLAAHSGFIQVACSAVRERAPRLRYPNFGNMRFPVPPAGEQAAIVRFLAHADGRIRHVIAAKQKLIKILQEQNRAIIHGGVTRGLDPNVRLKPSGIAWLGDVPAHWIVSRIKSEFSCLNPKRVPLSATERGRMTLRQYDYYGASGVIDKVDNFLFDDELLLLAEDGANLVLRNLPLAIVARGQFWVNNHAHILKPLRGHIEYLAAVLETVNYEPWITGAAQPKLTKDRLMGIQIAVAPIGEQHAIMRHLRQQTAPLQASLAVARAEITLLREYRTRLIADVVTGKLDVRAAAAALPDAPDDVAAIEEAEELDDDAGEELEEAAS